MTLVLAINGLSRNGVLSIFSGLISNSPSAIERLESSPCFQKGFSKFLAMLSNLDTPNWRKELTGVLAPTMTDTFSSRSLGQKEDKVKKR